jgi:adenosylcobinamide kinase/adenosylcobinamide-phosphate guanylyltransferase
MWGGWTRWEICCRRHELSRKCVLIIGGAGSGKSHFAQELALKLGGSVLFVATAEAGDEEMRQRIEQHKRKRSAAWSTLEVTTGVGRRILEKIGAAQVVVVDCITLLVSNIFSQYSDQSGGRIDAPLIEQGVMAEVGELIDCIKRVDVSFIIVSNEVGLGVVPANRMGRLYRDLLAKANRMLAQAADEVYLMVVGLPLLIKSTP